jgi:hypothetical protein
MARLKGIYSEELIEITEWCMALDPLTRPQSVFSLQKELARETDRRYAEPSVGSARVAAEDVAPVAAGGSRR